MIEGLFARINTHIKEHCVANKPLPYAMDQPFINYHAIREGLYENQLLKPHVALFEDEEIPPNRNMATICHFSFPIGNYKHKYQRMTSFFKTSLTTYALIDASSNLVEPEGRTYSWGTYGSIIFHPGLAITTTWGKGHYYRLGPDIICAYWNNHSHILRINEHSYMSTRFQPMDFEFGIGTLQRLA